MRLADMNTHSHGGFQFSAVRPAALGATEYTLATLVLDKTGSVSGFADQMNEIKKRVVDACRKSPRADFVLLRVVEFNSQVDEVHGFTLLSQIDPAAYTVPECRGMTALRDAVFSAVGATNAYARTLADQDYLVNALVFIGTDGDDNQSRTAVGDVAAEIRRAVQGEHLESIKTILVAVNAQQYEPQLRRFAGDVGVDEYIDVGDATPQKLAKLADFVSQSLSATSQAIGTGGASQAIVF
jgi:uncharacterized protein YegL